VTSDDGIATLAFTGSQAGMRATRDD
jgi:hypothetical protein